MDIKALRVEQLKAFVKEEGGAANVARTYEGIDASYLSQLINGHRPFGEKSARRIEQLANLPYGYFDQDPNKQSSTGLVVKQAQAEYVTPREIQLKDNPEYPSIKRVNLRLSAGIVGFSIDYDIEDKTPIVMRRDWFVSRGYKPEKLLAVEVKGDSMQTGLYDGDTVVINTLDNAPKDGEVFAINYEGEMLIKRMVRDAGTWWLSSDNPDQRKHPRKECSGSSCIVIGKIVHKQSERI